jgi:hypothetical protein
MKEIEITIDKDGNIAMDHIGWHGKGCAKSADEIAKVLGGKMDSTKKKEYWKEEVKVKQKVRHT